MAKGQSAEKAIKDIRRKTALVHESRFSSNAPLSIGPSRSEFLRARHPKLGHPIQQVARGHRLCPLSPWIASPNGRANDAFVSIEGILGSSLAVLPRLSSPLWTANASDPSDVPVSGLQHRVL